MSEHERGAAAEPPARAPSDELLRQEEELEVGREERRAGAVRVRKHVDTETAEEFVDTQIERLDDVERVAPDEEDSGQIETLPDGSVSIPILEEELVVSKRLVVRERVIIRKRTETEQHRVEAELRKERIELDADEGVELEPSSETGGTT